METSNQTWRFILRFLVVYSIQLVIKGFDHSFGNFLDVTIRGQVIGWTFIFLWMLAWYGSEFLYHKLVHFKSLYKLLVFILFGALVAFISNIVYKYSDIHLFANEKPWENISDFNPEFIFGILVIYLLIYLSNEYIQNKLEIKEAELRSEQLKKENLLAQFQSLKHQIEPHFLFNSLSVLSSIIHEDVDLADKFIIRLSKTLRYLIEKNEFSLVPLSEELQVVEDYFFLLKTRFGNALQLSTELNGLSPDEIYVPPATIQMLLENAVKHNKFSATHPLRIQILLNNDRILVSNNIDKRNIGEDSTKIGLKNIERRYELISGHKIEITETQSDFCVSLPVLKKSAYENFNH